MAIVNHIFCSLPTNMEANILKESVKILLQLFNISCWHSFDLNTPLNNALWKFYSVCHSLNSDTCDNISFLELLNCWEKHSFQKQTWKKSFLLLLKNSNFYGWWISAKKEWKPKLGLIMKKAGVFLISSTKFCGYQWKKNDFCVCDCNMATK